MEIEIEKTHSASEPCQGKTCLKIFVGIIPKDGLASWGPVSPPFGMTPTGEYNLWRQQSTIYSRCHTQRRIGGTLPSNPSLGMTTKKDLKTQFPMTRLKYDLYSVKQIFIGKVFDKSDVAMIMWDTFDSVWFFLVLGIFAKCVTFSWTWKFAILQYSTCMHDT